MFRAFFIGLEGSIKLDQKFVEQSVDKDKFFRSPLNNTLQIWETQSDTEWQFRVIKFFDDQNIRAVACAFTTSEAEITQEEIDKTLGAAFRGSSFDFSTRSKLIWLNGEFDHQNIQRASQFLRGTYSLQEKEFETISKVSFVADGKGVALIDKSWDSLDRAKRLQLVIALSCAYQAVLNDAIDDLAVTATQNTSLSEAKLRKWSQFLSANYFGEPIKTSSTELIHCYANICKRQRIDIQYKEVTEQLKLLSDLVLIDRAEEAKKEADKTSAELARKSISISRKGLWIAFCATFLALSSVPQFTPKAVKEFTSSWGCFLNSSIYKATCEDAEEIKKTPPIAPKVKKQIK